MAKNASKNTMGFALQFIGSLFFLATIAVLYPAGATGVAASFWTSVVYAVAVISSVALFFTSFAALSNMAGMAAWKAMSTATFAGVALVTITVGNSTWFVATLIGFILAFLGSASAMQDMKK